MSPVDVGVQQYRCVLRKLGEVDHFGLQLGTVTLADPSVWKSVHIRKTKKYGSFLDIQNSILQTTSRMQWAFVHSMQMFYMG